MSCLPVSSTSEPALPSLCAPEAERYVLGALLTEPEQCAGVVGLLEPESFYDPRHQAIYRVIIGMFDAGEAVDPMTVGRRLGKGNSTSTSVSPAYLAGMIQAVGSASHIEAHARTVKEKQVARQVIRIGRELTDMAADPGRDIDEALQFIAQEADRVNTLGLGGKLGGHIGESLKKSLTMAESRAARAGRGETTGIPTGLRELDRLTGGWQGSQLVILAARPAMGKTALMLHMAKAAAKAGVPVSIYSLEMSQTSLADRLLLSECAVPPDNFRNGQLTAEDWRALELATDRLSQLPIYVDDKPTVSMRYIKSHSRVMARQGKCSMILIDYLQLADMSTGDKTRNREQEVAQASRQAKIIAKELNVPVVLLSQLSRNVEGRADKRPLLSDLRESGAIEQDADIVTFIHRPAYYGIGTIPTARSGQLSTEGLGILSVAKQRDGACGDVVFRHNPAMTQIEDWESI